MIEKSDIIKLFYKYGFDSFTKEPFLYAEKKKIGIYYTLKNSIYGYLNRVFLPNSLTEAEDFLKNYYLYKKNLKKEFKTIELSSYNDPYAIPTFRKNDTTNNEEIAKTTPKQKRKLRTAYLLIEIIGEKIYLQNCTYNNLEDITYKYYETKKKWTTLKNEFEKTTTEIEEYPKNQMIEEDIEKYTKPLKEELENYKTDEEITNFITNLTLYLRNLEKNTSLLQNKYYLITTPLKIELLENEIKILEKLLEKRKNPLKKKENLQIYFDKIEEKSEINKIISLENYIKNEEKRIDEKYSMISEMDYCTIADYLIEFDNLKITEPNLKKQKKDTATTENHTFEETMEVIENDFNKLNDLEKNDLYIATSFLKYIIRENKETILKNNQELITETLKIINSPNNLLAKIKIFKYVDTSNVESFLNSLDKILNSINNLPKFSLLTDLNIFFQEEKILTNKKYIYASSKKNNMPIYNNNLDTIKYIATLKKDANILFTPKELLPDITNDEQLILKDNHPIFIIDMKKNIISEENSDIIKVSDYQINKMEITNIKTVTELKNNKVECYKKITITGKEENNERKVFE